ncbi:MAG: adenosylmethionine decarboxylase [Candidatus Aenigmarchaeota archaeon]|nr:adenosylmethionine decarboxylase [Candidatus Aenigmarchaeota archaeon]
MFGPHLTLDLYECNKEKLADAELIFELLDKLPTALNLTKLTQPFVDRYSSPTPGISGFILIGESHISIHTFVEERFASVDIFSCKNFDAKKAIDYVTRALEPRKVEKRLFMRGKHYPADIRKAIQLALKQREKSLP